MEETKVNILLELYLNGLIYSPMITIAQSKQVWLKLIADRLESLPDADELICAKLKSLRFMRSGDPRPGRIADYTKKHFPALLELYYIRRQALEIPRRARRIETIHHKKDRQFKLLESNQLLLFK